MCYHGDKVSDLKIDWKVKIKFYLPCLALRGVAPLASRVKLWLAISQNVFAFMPLVMWPS